MPQVCLQNGSSKEAVYEKIRIRSGYKSMDPINQLLLITEYAPEVQSSISERERLPQKLPFTRIASVVPRW